MAYTHLEPGEKLEVSEQVHFNIKNSDISTLVRSSPEELKKKEIASVKKEQDIFDELSGVIEKWQAQAAQTLSYRKAQEYLKVRPPGHTSNQWKENRYGRHEMSNMVYSFSWRVDERTKWDRAAQESIPVAWDLSWSVTFNTPANPDYSGSGRQIAGQDRKVFKDRAAMEKYLQGRINAYAHLFTEISPPIPKGVERRFSVNGVLLPGYTVEVPEKTPQEVADELLDFLEDEDTPPPPQVEPEKPPHQSPSRPAHKKHPPRKQRDDAPTR